MALDAAGLGIWDLDLKTDRCDRRSLQHDKIFGYTKLQPAWGRAITESHIICEDRSIFNEAFDAAMDTGLLHYEVRVRWSDGSVHWAKCDGCVVYDGGGVPERMTGIVVETTQQKQAFLNSARADGLLDAIFEAAPVGLGAWDEDLRFLRVNAKLADINGLPRDAHIGKRPGDLLPDIANMEEVYRKWRHILATGEPLLNVEVTGATPAQPGVQRSWTENFFPIKSGTTVVGIGAIVEETTERKRQQLQLDLLLEEVNHRAKNLLAVVQAVVWQLARSESEHEFVGRFSKHLASLAASHDLLVSSCWGGVDLSELAHAQLSQFKDQFATRWHICGPRVMLNSAAAQTLGMAIHELGMNAATHGSLSVPAGRVTFTWEIIKQLETPQLVMSWSESGGPAPKPDGRQGFGHKVITRMVSYAIDAEVDVAFGAEGFSWRCAAPCALLLATPDKSTPDHEASP